MRSASTKHVATVQNEEEAQKGKNNQNRDVFGDEYRIKPVEEVKYMKNGAEEEQKIAVRNQENLGKSANSNVRLKTNKEIPGLVHLSNQIINDATYFAYRSCSLMVTKAAESLDTTSGCKLLAREEQSFHS